MVNKNFMNNIFTDHNNKICHCSFSYSDFRNISVLDGQSFTVAKLDGKKFARFGPIGHLPLIKKLKRNDIQSETRRANGKFLLFASSHHNQIVTMCLF